MIHKDTIILLFLMGYFLGCKAQKTFGEDHLSLEKSISLTDVNGRIDHMDVNLRDQVVYIAALGNNTLEIVDIGQGKRLHSIKGLYEPQGVAYIPQQQEIFVANGGNGDCNFYNARTYMKTGTVHLSSDADDVRYDSTERKIYVGYGDGAIAMIDADDHKQVGNVKLSGHPEGFQIDKALSLLYVNVPDSKTISVIDLKTFKLKENWSTQDLRANFPMAIDTIRHRIFIGYRRPAKLVVMDGKTGKEISRCDMVDDVDDVYYDSSTKKVLVSGGGGYVNIFKEDSTGQEGQIANIQTKNGARTSLLIPALNVFIVAAREMGKSTAQLQVYQQKK
ncbi:MAG: YncE family protein [Flavisolibacter sp.]